MPLHYSIQDRSIENAQNKELDNMLRINETAIVSKDRNSFYKGEPFTGIVFIVQECVILDAQVYKNGKPLRKYSSEYLDDRNNHLHVISTCLEPENSEDYEPALVFMDKLFSGIAYDFDSEFCTCEAQFFEGIQESHVWYYRSGDLRKLELLKDLVFQSYRWDEHGEFQRYQISRKNTFRLELSFTEEHKVNSIILLGPCFEKIREVASEVKFREFLERKEICELVAAEKLFLSGNSINDEFFHYFLEGHSFMDACNLRLLKVSLSRISLARLIPFVRLRSLSVEDTDSLRFEDLSWFKSQRPDCHIESNWKAVE